MSGKGDKRRPGDSQAYRDNHDRIFRRKPKRERRHEKGCPALLAWDVPDACRCKRRYGG